MCKQSHHRTSKQRQTSNVQSIIQQVQEDDVVEGEPGQHLHMDFGFVRGTGYKIKMEDKLTITSIDGYNSYLIIVDQVSRYIWIFLTASKSPPIFAAQSILKEFKSKTKHRTVRTDPGKELERSTTCQEMVHVKGFTLELTGADASP